MQKIITPQSPYQGTVNEQATILCALLNGLMTVMLDADIIKLLAPKNIKGGLKIMRESKTT